MSEIPELPTHRPLTRPVPEGGLEAALRTGRRRRNRFVGAAGGLTTALVLVVAAGLLAPAPTNDSLQFADPSPSSSAPAMPAPTARVALPESSPFPLTLPRRSPSPRAEPTGSAGGSETPSSATVTPSPGATPAFREHPRTFEGTCGDTIVMGPNSWCYPARHERVVSSGDQVDLIVGICNSGTSLEPLELVYADGQEHEVTVKDDRSPSGSNGGSSADEGSGAALRWTWSRSLRILGGPHERQVPPGACTEWTTRWDTRDQDGRLLPPGHYVVAQQLRSDFPYSHTAYTRIRIQA